MITALACRRIHFARLFSVYEDHIFVFMFTLSTFFCINMLRTPLLSALFNPLNFLMLHLSLYHFGTGRLLTASLVSGRLLFLTRYIKLKRLLKPAASPSALFVLILFFSDFFSSLSAFPRYHHCVSWQARTFRSVADSPGLILLAGCSSFAGYFPLRMSDSLSYMSPPGCIFDLAVCYSCLAAFTFITDSLRLS